MYKYTVCTGVVFLVIRYCVLGCHCGAFLPIGRRHLSSYNHKLSSSPSATNTMFSSVLAFCERDMAPRVSNLMAPWKHRKRSVFRLQGVQFDGSAKRQNRSCTKQMDFGCKLFNQGRETKFWAAALLMWFSILGKTRGNLHTSEYLPGYHEVW